MRALYKSLPVFVLTAAFGGCASTHFVSTWMAPGAELGELDGEKVAAFLISQNEPRRRAVEDALAHELTARGGDGVPGYTLIPGGEKVDAKEAKRKLTAAGVDAVVTMQVVKKDDRVSTTPATWHAVPTYRRWGGHWTRSWRLAYTPGTIRTDTIVEVETLIYSVASEELLWAGLSRTTNPGRADKFVNELAGAVDDAMKESGFLE